MGGYDDNVARILPLNHLQHRSGCCCEPCHLLAFGCPSFIKDTDDNIGE